MKRKDQLLEDVYQYRRAVVLLAAAELGIFDYILDHRRSSARQLSTHFGWERRGTEIILNALCGLDYLTKKQGWFTISPAIKKVFNQKEFPLLKEWLHHEWRLLNRWVHLPEVVRTGKPFREPEKKSLHRNHRNFILSMAHREKQNIQSVVKKINLNGCHYLLDLGAGPGLFAAAFAEKYPQLHAIIFDTPDTAPIARQFFTKSTARNRLRFMAGDFLTDPIGSGYDAVLLSSVLHIYSPDENRKLLQKVYQSLQPGGKIFIRDFLLNQPKTSPLIGVLFAVNMLINTERGNAYSLAEMKNWMKEAGFKNIKKQPLEGRMLLLEAHK